MFTNPDVEQSLDGRGNQSIIIDNGKYMAVVVVLAIVCGLSTAMSFSIYQDSRNLKIDLQDEYQKTRNHTIELEARTKVLADEVQNLKEKVNERR